MMATNDPLFFRWLHWLMVLVSFSGSCWLSIAPTTFLWHWWLLIDTGVSFRWLHLYWWLPISSLVHDRSKWLLKVQNGYWWFLVMGPNSSFGFSMAPVSNDGTWWLPMSHTNNFCCKISPLLPGGSKLLLLAPNNTFCLIWTYDGS